MSANDIAFFLPYKLIWFCLARNLVLFGMGWFYLENADSQ